MSKYKITLTLEDVDLELSIEDVRELLEIELRHIKSTKRVDIEILDIERIQR